MPLEKGDLGSPYMTRWINDDNEAGLLGSNQEGHDFFVLVLLVGWSWWEWVCDDPKRIFFACSL